MNQSTIFLFLTYRDMFADSLTSVFSPVQNKSAYLQVHMANPDSLQNVPAFS